MIDLFGGLSLKTGALYRFLPFTLNSFSVITRSTKARRSNPADWNTEMLSAPLYARAVFNSLAMTKKHIDNRLSVIPCKFKSIGEKNSVDFYRAV